MSHTEQHQEISFVEQRPDGRTFSLSMSVSTPLASRQQSVAIVQPSSGLRHCSFMKNLSPLSDFSMSNNDDRHIQRHALSRPVEMSERRGQTTAHSALATNHLVEKLTVAEPDEPYWDFMHNLKLANQALDTLNMLDEFCPRLEELDASGNALRQVSGAPASLRHFNLSRNALSSLTDFSHLRNLQYLNLSNNSLTNLTNFSSLVHLRELNLDDNQIENIEGILDLDGLISVSLKRNKLSAVDFTSSQSIRLRTLNLSCNTISSINGLAALTVLEVLDIRMNQLSGWSKDQVGPNATLKKLMICSNKLNTLDVAGLPSLEAIYANANHLTRVANVLDCVSLHSLHLDHQQLGQKTYVSITENMRGVTHLHLSKTSLGRVLPIEVPFLNLRTLDASFTGLQALPSDFGTLVPNLRILILTNNNIKDLRPLEGIVALQKLHVAYNRLSRLRNFVKVLSRLGGLLKGGSVLQEIDARGNPLTSGFHSSEIDGKAVASMKEGDQYSGAWSLIAPQKAETDELHLSRMDRDTKMKRRVYEMLVGSKCPKLVQLDGLAFQREELQRRDDIWEGLVGMGVLRKAE